MLWCDYYETACHPKGATVKGTTSNQWNNSNVQSTVFGWISDREVCTLLMWYKYNHRYSVGSTLLQMSISSVMETKISFLLKFIW